MIKNVVIDAYVYAEASHRGQKRKFTGKPYFTHVKAVSRILEMNQDDPEIVACGLLHDVIEDTPRTYEDIKKSFGRRIADIVQELTNDQEEIERMGGKTLYLANKIIRMSSDARTVKLADRFHNVLHLIEDDVEKGFMEKYYKETKFIILTLECSEVELTDCQKKLLEGIRSGLKVLKIRYQL